MVSRGRSLGGGHERVVIKKRGREIRQGGLVVDRLEGGGGGDFG